MSKSKYQIKSKYQMSKEHASSIWILDFDIDLTFGLWSLDFTF